MIDPMRLALRDVQEGDIPMIVGYWYDSPREYIEGMGVDLSKLKPRMEFEGFMIDKCRASSAAPSPTINAVIVTLDGRPVGFHSLNPFEPGDYGVFHAHVLDPTLRRQGIARWSYRAATRLFMERFNLKRILFKTPVQNAGANRVKERIGIRKTGEETVTGFNILKDGTRVNVYELTREEAENL